MPAPAASYHHNDAEEEVDYPDGLTEFEKERLANIKRNQAVLEGLGLGMSSTILGHARGVKTKATPKSSRPKPPPRPPTVPSRRSLRNLGKEAPDYRDIPDFLFKPGSNGSNRPIGADDRGEEEGPGENWDPSSRPLKKAKLIGGASEPTPGSSRIMNANVEGMLAQYLGNKVPYTGKQTVMDLLSASGSPKFSKYAGVVEWKNTIVLWVNADGNDYANLFLKNGQEMTWFAGSRCNAETPVIQRLLEVGIDPAASKAKTAAAAAADKGGDGDGPAAVVDGEGKEGLLEVAIDPAAVKTKALEAAVAAAAATALDSGDSGGKDEEKKNGAKEERQLNKRKQKSAKAIAVEGETVGPAGGEERDREGEEDGAAARGERRGQKDGSSCTSSAEASSSSAAGEGGEKEVTSSSAAESAESDEILLFVRLTGEPYVCFGRVYHVWFDTRRHPIKMLWRLRDYKGLKGQADFEEIVGKGGGPSSSAAVAAKEQ